MYVRVFGEFYLQQLVSERITPHAVPIVLVADLDRGETLLFDADIQAGYEIDIPPGIYLMLMLLIDGTEPHFADAAIYAYGFPSREDLSGVDSLELDDPHGIWAIVEDEPLIVPTSPSAYLDYLVVDADTLPTFPRKITQLVQAPLTDLPCPQCNGDGYVGYDDLHRLAREGRNISGWLPGQCQLCQGLGTVNADYELFRNINTSHRPSS